VERDEVGKSSIPNALRVTFAPSAIKIRPIQATTSRAKPNTDTAGEVPMIRINNHRLNEKVRKISPLRLMKAPAEAGFSRIFDFASSITFGDSSSA
jgi:hypothetical protein